MTAVALFNRYALAPRLAPEGQAFSALRRNCIVEVALGATVIALVSVFGMLDPS